MILWFFYDFNFFMILWFFCTRLTSDMCHYQNELVDEKAHVLIQNRKPIGLKIVISMLAKYYLNLWLYINKSYKF